MNYIYKRPGRRILIGFGVLALLSAAIAMFLRLSPFSDEGEGGSVASLIDERALSQLPVADESSVFTDRVADGLLPPTNKWYSGAVLQKEPKVIFAMPLAMKVSDQGFSYNVPSVSVSEKTIAAPFVPEMTMNIESASSFKLSRYDELSFDLTYYDSQDQAIGILTITAGSPYIFFSAANGEGAVISTDPSLQLSDRGDSLGVTKGDTEYNILSSHGDAQQNNSGAIIIPSGQFVTLYAGSPNDTPMLERLARNKMVSTNVSYEQDESTVQTTLQFETINGEDTYLSSMPHQVLSGKADFAYEGLYGSLETHAGKKFQYSSKKIAVTPNLSTEAMKGAERELFIDQLRKDINATTFNATDTYFGGKDLYRAAQLLMLAKEVGESTLADSIQDELSVQFDMWLSVGKTCSPKSFCFDENVGGIVSGESSFGSEEFNDHHFHYGYFIYAAAIMAQYDSTFVARHGAMINLLVADIANYKLGEALPLRRAFDPYGGHSWASGSSPFDDGNNQESSSEAANAWVGMSLWAEQTGNIALKDHASWLLSNEVLTGKSYWLLNERNEAFASYGSDVISLNWGGKRDYATWFSAEPSAILGIQLIPMSPTMLNYLDDLEASTVGAQTKSIPQPGPDVPLGDYVAMYRAVSGEGMTFDDIASLRDAAIDGGNSKSYMMAWFASR